MLAVSAAVLAIAAPTANVRLFAALWDPVRVAAVRRATGRGSESRTAARPASSAAMRSAWSLVVIIATLVLVLDLVVLFFVVSLVLFFVVGLVLSLEDGRVVGRNHRDRIGH